MRSKSKNVKKTLRKTFYREKKRKLKNENKGLEEINMQSSSKNVKIDPQEYVYQGSALIDMDVSKKHEHNSLTFRPLSQMSEIYLCFESNRC